jgi:hypothetical protein
LSNRLLEQTLFCPAKNKFSNPHWVDGKAGKLACYYVHKYPKAKTVILFHGNGETVKDNIDDFGQIFGLLKLNFLFAEYRGYGMSDGEPSLSGLLEDVKPIIDSIEVPPENLVVYGRSFGSLSAVHAVSVYPCISGLILESGIASFSSWLLLADELTARDPGNSVSALKQWDALFNMQAKVSCFCGSTLIFHCQKDFMIPVENAYELFDWSNKPKHKVIYQTGDHNNYIAKNFDDYGLQLMNFIESILKRKNSKKKASR